MGLTLTISYQFTKHIPIDASHFIVAPGYAGQNNGMPHYHFVHGLPSSMERESAVMKCRVAPGTAKTGNRDNDTPVQSQSERDKTVAGNEGGSGRPSEGWNSRGVSSLLTVWRLPIAFRGVEDKLKCSYHKAR